ncbi:hypothetical protein RB195_010437 [Necator americanus]|uniref:Transthyretin-like family protein n=1 Tax=Necator americanus TaxID=51031 RepID=A0ABR1CXZ7_NECAM
MAFEIQSQFNPVCLARLRGTLSRGSRSCEQHLIVWVLLDVPVSLGQGVLEYAIVINDFFSPSLPIADVLFHRVAKSYFRATETAIKSITKGWYYRDVEHTLPSVGEYVVDFRTSRATGRFPCPPTMIFFHEKRVPMKEASGGQQPGEAIASFIPVP